VILFAVVLRAVGLCEALAEPERQRDRGNVEQSIRLQNAGGRQSPARIPGRAAEAERLPEVAPSCEERSSCSVLLPWAGSHLNHRPTQYHKNLSCAGCKIANIRKA
jgi:hypothetical protein